MWRRIQLTMHIVCVGSGEGGRGKVCRRKFHKGINIQPWAEPWSFSYIGKRWKGIPERRRIHKGCWGVEKCGICRNTWIWLVRAQVRVVQKLGLGGSRESAFVLWLWEGKMFLRKEVTWSDFTICKCMYL